MVADWLRRHLPAQVNLPPDSLSFARDHWEATKARGKRTEDPMAGTRWEHHQVEPVRLVDHVVDFKPEADQWE